MKLPEIKPCPHCGSPARLDTQRFKVDYTSTLQAEYAVECTNLKCWATVGPQDTPREAIDVWNQRAT